MKKPGSTAGLLCCGFGGLIVGRRLVLHQLSESGVKAFLALVATEFAGGFPKALSLLMIGGL